MKRKDEIPITIRFPAKLVTKLKKLAKDETRSLNSEVVHVLSVYAQQKEKEQCQ